MFNSLKSKFIISFITIEIIFFTLIVSLNFNSLNKASQTLTDEKMHVSSQLLIELIKTPLITYDLATLDDIVKNFSNIKNVIAIQVDDVNDNIISSYIKEETISEETFKNLIHDNTQTLTKDRKYISTLVEITVDDEHLGHIEFVFDNSEHIKIIKSNQNKTYILIAIALLIGFLISYFVGNKLEKSLKHLTKIAKDVADDKNVVIPYNDSHKDEMDELFYAMHRMQKHISERTLNLNNSINDLQQFINALNHSAIVSKTDTKGVITYVNSKFCEVTGYSEEELLGQTHNILRDKEVGDDFYKDMWETITAKKIFHSTFKNIKKSGEPYYVDATIVPLLDREGNVIEYIAIRYEVTEIVDAKDKAIEAKRIKENFLSNMSHEIRTPMNAILGFVQILQKNTTNKTNLSHLKTIQNSSESLLHIINDILDFSKIESGKLVIDKHPFIPQYEFTQTIELFAINAQDKSINLVTNIDSDIPNCFEGDLTRIKQIMFNFLSNAIKFTKDGKSIFIDITYKTKTSLLCISVKDEGIGMSKEAQSKVFNAFEQADNSTTRQFGGTGLGLSISSKLASLMNGEITLESTEGMGSTFSLYIPLKVCKLNDKNLSLNDLSTEDKRFTGKVLVAEDNKTNQMLIKILLEDYGVEYTITDDGLQAFKAFKTSKYDMVLMDENMPNMTGIQTLEKILKYEEENQLKHTPVIALTANVMQEYKQRFAAAGMDDFLAKPINYTELERVLERFLHNSKI